MNFSDGSYPKPWLHSFEHPPIMPWTVIDNDPAVPWVLMESAGFTYFRMFRPQAAICVGDTIE
jgi:hypothetical protein